VWENKGKDFVSFVVFKGGGSELKRFGCVDRYLNVSEYEWNAASQGHRVYV